MQSRNNFLALPASTTSTWVVGREFVNIDVDPLASFDCLRRGAVGFLWGFFGLAFVCALGLPAGVLWKPFGCPWGFFGVSGCPWVSFGVSLVSTGLLLWAKEGTERIECQVP